MDKPPFDDLQVVSNPGSTQPVSYFLAQQQSLEIPTSAVVSVSVAFVGALLIGTTKFFIDQALRRWVDKIDALNSAVARLDTAVEAAPSHKEFQHFEQRLSNLGGALQANQDHYREVQNEILQIRKALSSNYLQREDWVKSVAVTEAKLDALHRRLDEMSLMLVRALRTKEESE
ncbi:MAG: hypothetical protein AAFX78_01895 [Cyanobacteria bacterium J06638_20]